MLDENLENKDTLNTIQEEEYPREGQKVLDSIDADANRDAQEEEKEEDDEEDTKCQFPDTQIKIDLSGPKYVDAKLTTQRGD